MSEPVASLVFECNVCGQMEMADPELVMSIDARRRDGQVEVRPGDKNPVCEACARRKIALHKKLGWPVPALFEDPGYWTNAYPQV